MPYRQPVSNVYHAGVGTNVPRFKSALDLGSMFKGEFQPFLSFNSIDTLAHYDLLCLKGCKTQIIHPSITHALYAMKIVYYKLYFCKFLEIISDGISFFLGMSQKVVLFVYHQFSILFLYLNVKWTTNILGFWFCRKGIKQTPIPTVLLLTPQQLPAYVWLTLLEEWNNR